MRRGRDPSRVVSDPAEFQRVQVPDDVAETLVYFASMAADMEALRAGPPSGIRGPHGERQPETPQEFVRRVVTAGVLHLVETGLLTVPDDFATRSSGLLPLSREDSRA
jgi:hypothetical protein